MSWDRRRDRSRCARAIANVITIAVTVSKIGCVGPGCEVWDFRSEIEPSGARRMQPVDGGRRVDPCQCNRMFRGLRGGGCNVDRRAGWVLAVVYPSAQFAVHKLRIVTYDLALCAVSRCPYIGPALFRCWGAPVPCALFRAREHGRRERGRWRSRLDMDSLRR